jgi:choline dehydrogenase-like flavoprotein
MPADDDSALVPSSCAINPSLTAMANALRAGDHLLERLGSSPDASAVGER